MGMSGTIFKLPRALTVDSNSAFEAILTDIPLFCAGLTGLAFVTLVFLIKRANSSMLYLGAGTLLLFISAILDLGQLLESQSSPADKDRVDASGLIVAREVGLGLAYGFVFLFAWNAVAQRRELEHLMSATAQQPLHHASWTRRLKPARTGLRWFALLLVISIPLLQVSWRIDPSQRRYGGLYITESTLEIVTSVILIIEIMLNVFTSLPASWWLPCQRYLGLILGLLVTAAIGIGNLVTFAFSEMVLGRFLRAISIYIFLLYNLTTIFSAVARDRLSPFDEETPARSEKPTELATHDTHLRPENQTAGIASEPAAPAQPNDERSSLSITASSRFSKLVSRVEPTEAFAGVTRTMSNRKSSITPTAPKRHKRPDLRFDIMTPVLSSMPEDPEFVGDERIADISLSYYTMDITSPTTASPTNRGSSDSASPDDQLGGAADLQRTSVSDSQLPDHRSFSVTSSEELMLSEGFDKNMARPGVLSVDEKKEASQDIYPTLRVSMSSTGDTSTSAKNRRPSTLKTDSLSVHSDFSLSVFPTPPPRPRPESMLGERGLSRPMFLHRKLPPLPIADTTQEANPVPEPPTDAIMASSQTQYDVTSFIDDLSNPDDRNAVSTEALVQSNHDGDDAGDRLPLESVGQKQPMMQLKPMLLPSVANERGNLPTMSLRPVRKTSYPYPTVRFQEPNTTLKPLLLGKSATSIPALLTSSTMVPLGTRKISEAKRVGKRQISAPQVDTTEVDPEAFERPRRPPEYSTSVA